jgi:succinate-semialdehyde dehydrogenase/glutarate-semialdehyde dehydrogenase
MESINPATGQLIKKYRTHTAADVERILARAARTATDWRDQPLRIRVARLREAARLLRSRSDKYAALITAEMGKPLAQSAAEVEKCALACDYYADNAAVFLADEPIKAGFAKSYVKSQPVGPVLAVMPWNFPFWQVFRFAAPALVVGNVGLLKHASNVSGCALAIEKVLMDAGFPRGAFQTLLVPARQVEKIIEDDRVAAVTLTGSEPAGQAVAATAGRQIKKTVLELGGSDPFIVLADANLEKAVEMAITSRTNNAGQSCIAAKRFILEKPIAKRFIDLMSQRMAELRVGDPLDLDTQVGPLARVDLRDELHRQVRASVRAGAKIATGGQKVRGAGAYYQPTVLTDVRPGNPAYEQEFFGPVAIVITVPTAEAAIKTANDSRFGLGGAVWTRSTKRGERLAAQVESGFVAVNGMVASHPALPFGGVKKSGYGRELSKDGILEFVNRKTITVS